MSTPAIDISNLGKEFKTDFWRGKVKALEGVSFSVQKGSIFGLVGPNGSGKTTTIKIMMGLVRPTKGSVQIFGFPAGNQNALHHMGYLPENAYYYDYLKTEEVLDFYGRLFGLSALERKKRSDELLELVGLSDKRGVKLRHYSKGMLQRIGIAQAIINDPKVVVFDEPMSGLDPIGRRDVRDIILRLRDQGKTILFSSHILPDIEALCDHIAILIKGKLTASGSLGELINPRVKNTEVVFRGDAPVELPKEWTSSMKLRRVGAETIISTTDSNLLNDLIQWAQAKHLKLVAVQPQKETLEDLFVEQLEAIGGPVK